MASLSGLFTGFVDAGHLQEASSSFPGFTYGTAPGASGFLGGFPGFLIGGRFSGTFTGFVLGPPSQNAVGGFTGYVAGGGNYVNSSFPGFVQTNQPASGTFTGFVQSQSGTQGYYPFSGMFTGFVRRTTSSTFPGFVMGEKVAASGVFTGYTLGSQQASGLFPGVTFGKSTASGLYTGFTSGF